MAEIIASGDGWSLNDAGTLLISANTSDYVYTMYNRPRPPWYVYRSQIRGVKILNGVTRIGDYSFDMYPSNVKSWVIPTSVTYIGKENFYRPGDIFYAGTQEQWQAIEKNLYYQDLYINDNDPFSAILHYNADI